MIDRTVFEDLSHRQKKSPIVSQVCGARSISPPNCWAFANFWSIVLSPEKLESTLFWYRPVLQLTTWYHCNILAQLPLSLWERLWHTLFNTVSNTVFITVFNTVFGTLCLTRKGWLLGWAQSNALNISEVHHLNSCSYFLHRIYTLLILLPRPAGLSMATFGKVPLPAPSLCPAHPPPRSGELLFCQTSVEETRSKKGFFEELGLDSMQFRKVTD